MKWLLVLGLPILAWVLFLRPREAAPQGQPTPTPERVANPYKQSIDRAREVADQVSRQHRENLPQEP